VQDEQRPDERADDHGDDGKRTSAQLRAPPPAMVESAAIPVNVIVTTVVVKSETRQPAGSGVLDAHRGGEEHDQHVARGSLFTTRPPASPSTRSARSANADARIESSFAPPIAKPRKTTFAGHVRHEHVAEPQEARRVDEAGDDG
jgi:hypothetical protein